ncbi:MAG: S8 family serine peptidase, partial [Allosphingosinicella sp.]
VIIAGAVDANHNITTFSNRAGTSQSVYLAAIGSRVTAPDQTGALFLWSGPSFSAPVISGAVALLASAFPNLTGKQIMDILFTSADDAGAAGIDPIYGRGVLNIGRAFAPQGTLSLPGSQVAVASTAGTGSPATGDARPRIAGMVILDGYSRAYVMDMADALAQAAREQPLAAALQPGLHTATAGARNVAVSITMARNVFGAPRVGLAELGLSREEASRARFVSGLAVSRLGRRTAVALGLSETGRTLQQRLAAQSQNAFLVARDPLGRMGFQGDSAGSLGVRQQVRGVGVTLTAERGKVWQGTLGRTLVQPGYSIAALAFDRRLGPATVTLGASRLAEQDTLLGARFTAMLGAAGATSWFADAAASLQLGRGWDLAASYRRGWTSATGGVGLTTGGRLSTDAWNLDVARHGAFMAGDRLALRVMQPLRVRSGGIDLRVPVSYDYATLQAGYESRLFNLAPTGREIDVEAAYAVPLLGGELSANAFARRQPGNVAAIDRDLGAAIRFTLGF